MELASRRIYNLQCQISNSQYALITCLFVLLGMLSANALAESKPPTAPAPSLPQHKRLGAVRLTLDADRLSMGISDRLRVTVSVEAPPEVAVTFPQVENKLGPFTVLGRTPRAPTLIVPGIQQWQLAYDLEAENSGDLTLPPLTITLTKTGDPEAPVLELRTDPLRITVTTVLPEDADVTVPKDITPPVALTRHGMPPWVWIVLGVVVGLALLGALWWWDQRRRRRAAAVPQPQLAHVLTLEALRRLQNEGLMSQSHVEAFYVRVSDILRRYVEWRFGLHAPEQTTEEFLAAVHLTRGLIATHRDLLGTFLEHCDLVKFARHQPTLDDMQQAFDSAQDFVRRTADSEALVDVSALGVGTS